MKTFFFLGTLVLATCAALAAEPETKDPIDVALDQAIEKDPSTAGMVEAAAQAADKWHKEIDRALTELKKPVKPAQWKALQASQQAWRTYRDKELAAQDALYGAMEGTMWRVTAASKAMELNKARALQLRDYSEAISDA